MLSIFQQKKTSDPVPYLRRIVDTTTPNAGPETAGRLENRYNRTFPVLCCPFEENAAGVDEAFFGINRDISETGLSIVVPARIVTPLECFVGVWASRRQSDQPWFFLAKAVRSGPVGAGFWVVGIEIKEFAGASYCDLLQPLRPMAERLLPPEA